MRRDGTASTGVRRRRAAARRTALALLLTAAALAAASLAPPQLRASTAAELRQLARLDLASAEAVIRDQPTRIFELANAAPEENAHNWHALAADERNRLEKLFPGFVGNFDGAPYSIRDRANVRLLNQRLASTRSLAGKQPTDPASVLSLSAYTAIHAAATAKTYPRRHLVEFVPGVRPTAAIAIGDLDTARMVTWLVPGMGTYTTDMQLWTLAAQNVWDGQSDAGAPANHAVIAWMGYVVPPVGLDATLGEYAAKGAPLLTEAIQGVRAVRSDDLPTLNVVAHSYGTTMAADALADSDLGIEAFVMLGSAGVEESIPSAGAVHAAAVYAGEAMADTEARLGRFSRTDPRDKSFGARILPVDGDLEHGLLAITGHAPILHSRYNDDITSPVWTVIPSLPARRAAYDDHMRQRGYLDAGTQSLQEIARVTARSPRPLEVRAPAKALGEQARDFTVLKK